MLKRMFLTGTAVLAAAACGDAPTASDGPIQAAVTRTPICHFDKETGLYWLIAVRSGSAFQAHLDHGDGAPGGPVPGRNGYAFDDNCVPVRGMFAIAYTDINPSDGPGFKDGIDVLIAKLVDANNDGVPNVGDQVVMGRYPKDFDATQFGSWQVDVHTATTMEFLPDTVVLVGVETGFILFRSGDLHWTRDGNDEYWEYLSTPLCVPGGCGPDITTRITDDVWGWGDRILLVLDAGPSRPDASVDAEGGGVSGTDDRFIDVDIYR